MRLGKDKHAVILVFSLIICVLAGAQPGKSHKYHLNGDLQKSSVITGRDFITIYYSLPELNVENLTHGTEPFYRISVPGHMVTVDPGKPELPVFSNLITIPDGQTCRIIISDVKSERITPSKKGLNGLLYPAQEGETKQTKRGSSELRMDKKLYSMKSLIKSDTASIEYIGKVRGKQLANLLINPVRYNPGSNSLEVIRSMRINVEFTGDEIKQSGTAKGE